MKKNIIYILILIVFVEFSGLIPIKLIHAADNPNDIGTCNTNEGTQVENATRQQCTKIGGISFNMVAPAGTPVPTTDLATKGTCTYTDDSGKTSTDSQSTLSGCQNSQGSKFMPDTGGTATIFDPSGSGTIITTGTTGVTPTTPSAPADGIYHLLAPLPCRTGDANCKGGLISDFNPAQANNIGGYLNLMITTFIGICAVLAVIMIVVGGIEYMTTELISTKEAGKERIRNAIFGLLLALGAYAILFTINPSILKTDLSSLTTQAVSVDVGGESSAPFVPVSNATIKADGFTCPGNGGKGSVAAIAQSFVGKTNYTQNATARNTFNGSTYNGDCSSTVAQIYLCAGLENPGGNTAAIFSNQNSHDINGSTFDYTTLHPGDLVGWPPENDSKGKGNGHVMIYIGNGQVIDNQPSGTQVRQISNYASRITSVTWSN